MLHEKVMNGQIVIDLEWPVPQTPGHVKLGLLQVVQDKCKDITMIIAGGFEAVFII